MGTSTKTHGEPIELEPSQQRRIGAHVDEAATRLGTNAKAADALGIGVNVVTKLRDTQPEAQSVVVTIHDDDEHLFPALQAGAFGYILKEQPRELITEQLQRISQGEPPLSPSIARRVMAYFAAKSKPQPMSASSAAVPHVSLTDRETEVLLRVAKGYTLPEIGQQLTLSRHTIADYVKQIYRKLNVSSRAEAALEAQRMGLFGR